MLSAMASMMAAVNPGDAKAQMALFAGVAILLQWPVLALGGLSAWLGFQRQGVVATQGRPSWSDGALWAYFLFAGVSLSFWYIASSGA